MHPTPGSIGGKLVVVIDDDPLVLDSTGGLLRSWGCHVLTAGSARVALAGLAKCNQSPDLIISDYQPSDGQTGIEAIEELRKSLNRPIPAFLISGDTAPERMREARMSGYHLLHKPVRPRALRAMLSKFLNLLTFRSGDRSALFFDRPQLPSMFYDRHHSLGPVFHL